MNPFGKLFDGIKKVALVIFRIGDKVDVIFTKIENIMPEALDAVAQVAALTPNRRDDEIVMAVQKLNLKISYDLSRKEETLRKIAVTLLKKKVSLSLADSIVNAAVELAYVTFKNREQ